MKIGLMAIECILKYSSQRDEKKTEDKITPLRSGHKLRRRFRPRVRGRRRTTTTTESYPEPQPEKVEDENPSPAPVYPTSPPNKLDEFCDKVIRSITDSVTGDNFHKVAMYQDIWYLVSKYNIPVEDHSIDIVILIDELCNGDDPKDTKEDPINNNIDIGPANGLSLDHPTRLWEKPVRKSGGRRPPSVLNKGGDQRTKIESRGKTRIPVEKRQRTKGMPEVGSRGDFSFYPTRVEVEPVTKPPLLSPSYPRVVAYTPRPDAEDLPSSNHLQGEHEAPAFLLPSPTAGPGFPGQPARLPVVPDEEDVDVITLYPELDIRHMEKQGYQVVGNQPQDIMVETSFSFSGDSSPGKLKKGAVSNIGNHALPDDESSIQTFQVENFVGNDDNAPETYPSETGSSPFPPVVLLTTPGMRRGTVEDLPMPRPTLPPIVKTSSLAKKPRTDLEPHPNYPTLPPVVRKDVYEEPSRSSEEIEKSAFPRSRHSPQYVASRGYFPPPSSGALPQQREPYPYQNLPRPYLSAPLPRPPFPRSPSSAGMAVARRDEFNREDGETPMMSNKMDDMKFIDGYIDTGSSLPRVPPGYPRISEARPQERRSDPAGPATRCFKSTSPLTDVLHVDAPHCNN